MEPNKPGCPLLFIFTLPNIGMIACIPFHSINLRLPSSVRNEVDKASNAAPWYSTRHEHLNTIKEDNTTTSTSGYIKEEVVGLTRVGSRKKDGP